MALYCAKSEDRSIICFFDPAMEAQSREQRRMERDLRLALDTDQITLKYQPQFSCPETPVLVGFEALMRWTHPELGQIPPTRFIPVGEDNDLISTLGLWALERACAEACYVA